MQADAVLQEFLDEPDVVQALQGPPRAARDVRVCCARDTPANKPSVATEMAAASANCPATRSRSRAASSPGFRASHWVFKVAATAAVVNRLEVDRGEVGGLVVQGGETALLLEPFAVVGEGDVGPLGEEGTGELQGEREPAEQATDGLGLGPFGMVGVVADGLARVMAEEQLQGGLLGKDGDLDGWKRPSSRSARGEEDAAGEGRRTGFEADRAVELGGVVEVVEDDQGVGSPVEFLERGSELVIGRLVDGLGPQPGTDLGESLSERFGGVDPEDAAGVVVLVAVDVFDGELGLADAAHAGQPGGPDADRPSRLEDGVEPVEVVGATDEVGVPGERHEERNRARRGSRPSRQRA